MKAKDLIEYLQTFPPDAPVRIWTWNGATNDSFFFDCGVACNTEAQHERGIVLLRMDGGTCQRSETWFPEKGDARCKPS